MQNPEKIMKVVSIILLVFHILYAVGGFFLTAAGGLVLAISGTDSFAVQLAESLKRTGTTIEDLGEAARGINDRFGTNFTIMQLLNIIFILLIIFGIGMLLYAAAGIVCACLGFKASGGEKANAAFVWGIILLVCCLLRFGINFRFNVSAILRGLVSFVLPGLYTYAAWRLKEKSQG